MFIRSTLMLCGAALAIACAGQASAGTYTPIYQFTGSGDGAMPSAAVTYDEKGNLYGVTKYGGGLGTFLCSSYGCGTVYRVNSSGEITTLVIFNGSNGAFPEGPLTLVNHTLFGSTNEGGDGGDGVGVLFSVHTNGSHFKRLFVFHPNDYNGNGPRGPLVSGPEGALYGYAQTGGPGGQGVLFKLTPDGTFIHLHDFTGRADGGDPDSLVSDAAGTLYGSTGNGGAGLPG